MLVTVIAEGATLRHFDALAVAGLAPNWARLRQTSLTKPMQCGPAPYEPSNLASAFTGTGRGRHGCYSYWAMRDGLPDRPRVLTSADVQAPWFWHWPQLDGLRKAVFNVQLTDPPQPLDGILFSYLMQQKLRFTFPDDVREDMVRNGLRYGHDVSAFYAGGGFEWLWSRTKAIADYQLEAALTYGVDADILIINLTLIDRISHFFWADPAELVGDEACTLRRAYEWTDSALGRLDALAGDAPLLVFSEIGFGPIDGFVSLDDVLDAANLQTRSTQGELDYQSSAAVEAAQGAHGILVLEPSARSDVIAALTEATDPQTGTPLIASIHAAEEHYSGPASSLAPDLVIEPADPRRPPLGDARWANHVNRHLQTGWHRNEGFALWHRCGLMDVGAAGIHLPDIAPTLAGLVGRDAPAGLDGRCLAR